MPKQNFQSLEFVRFKMFIKSNLKHVINVYAQVHSNDSVISKFKNN